MATDADRPAPLTSEIARLAAVLRGKVRGRSSDSITLAERHLASYNEGVLILQMRDGLLDVDFLPSTRTGQWKIVLEPRRIDPELS